MLHNLDRGDEFAVSVDEPRVIHLRLLLLVCLVGEEINVSEVEHLDAARGVRCYNSIVVVPARSCETSQLVGVDLINMVSVEFENRRVDFILVLDFVNAPEPDYLVCRHGYEEALVFHDNEGIYGL